MKQKILDRIEDLVANFVFYDRKEDDELSIGDLNDTVATGKITVDEMVEEFRKHLKIVFES